MIPDSGSAVLETVKIQKLRTSAYTVPTDAPESDGTLEWNSTTLVLVEVEAGNNTGIGYTYGDASIASFIQKNLVSIVQEANAMDIPAIYRYMLASIRNEGNCGMAYMAVSAVDNALWDLKGKLLNLSLAALVGTVREEVPVYGSGGFTSYSDKKLCEQLGGWADQGFTKVKMKIGRDPGADINRVKIARQSIGDKTDLMIDANGAYDAKTAIRTSEIVAEYGVSWFEEPVSSDNLSGLKFIRDHVPSSINIAAGEYGYSLPYFTAMLSHQAVDILQADATRCGGITGFLKAGYLCEAHSLPFSFHCAPALHLHAAAALNSFYVGEYFHDHVRIENMFFDGVIQPVAGKLKPDRSRPGLGLEFKYPDAAKYKL
ncbi:enolase C-terminal domain-like protein [Rubrolithibacter danxiaensis]|uniref:enolase C-terminal domain-like protein n=1 Tax=Rubrolithibacter danxiaensis TaxID=3390805 RepID=UPI003BF82B9F